MEKRSIDGLRRRGTTDNISSGRTLRLSNNANGTVKSISKTRREALPTDNAQKRIDKERQVRNEKEIRDFLNSIQDENPTDLITINNEKSSKRKERKERKKAAKVAKRIAKSEDKRKKHKVLRTILIIFGILLLLGLGAAVWIYIQGNDLVARVTGGGNLWDVITADPDIPLKTDPVTGRTNVLIFGTEGYSMDETNYDGGWLTDSMMVASIDQDTGDVRTISLPRDLKSKTCTSTSKLNERYYCTYSKNDGSEASRQEHEKLAAESLAEAAEEILGIEIQYFVHVNWQAVVQIVDTLGGIDVVFVTEGQEWDGPEVTIETTDKRGLADYNRYCKCYVINYPNGEVVHLDGASALAVARARNADGGWGAGGGNFSREQFQQKIIQAVALKAKDTNFVTDFMAALKIKDAVGDNVRMDFEDSELKSLMKLVGKIDTSSMKNVSIQETDDGKALLVTGYLPVPGVNDLMNCGNSTPGCLSYVYPAAGVNNYSEIHSYVAKKLSSDPVVMEEAKVAVLNAIGVQGLASEKGAVLTEKGLNVVTIKNAPGGFEELEGVAVYQKNPDMTATAQWLADYYGVEITTTIPESLANESGDFIIVLGSGYDNY